MTTKIRYVYNSYLESCGCCSNSESWLEFEEEGRISEETCYSLVGNEEELRQLLEEQYPELTDYEVGDDCDYF